MDRASQSFAVFADHGLLWTMTRERFQNVGRWLAPAGEEARLADEYGRYWDGAMLRRRDYPPSVPRTRRSVTEER